jgi:hypothetical protein
MLYGDDTVCLCRDKRWIHRAVVVSVVAADINQLHLEHCEFEDEEAVQVLVDNVRVERGQKKLSLDGGAIHLIRKARRLHECTSR